MCGEEKKVATSRAHMCHQLESEKDWGSQHRELRRHTQGTRRELRKEITVLEARGEVFRQGGVVRHGEGAKKVRQAHSGDH